MSVWFPPGIESESVPCDHCRSSREQTLFEGPDRLHHLPGTFRVVECLECGWLRQNPRPTRQSIGFYYPSDYVNFVKAIEDEPTPWRRWDRRYGMVKRRRAVERLQKRGRLLDIGCATGIFLNEMQRAGWEVAGIETNETAAAYARQRFGLTVHLGELEGLDLPGHSFDVVTLWDVLEHLHSPWSDLGRICRLVVDGGLLVLRIPSLESMERRWFGTCWLGWDLPRHLYFVSQRSLADALSEQGFDMVGSACVATSHFAFLLSLQFGLEERYSADAQWPKQLLQVGKSVPVRLLLAPVFWAMDRARASSLITVFARKRATGGPQG